jgi:hypothetical protein
MERSLQKGQECSDAPELSEIGRQSVWALATVHSLVRRTSG